MGSSERSAADDIVSTIMGRWATAFSSLDASALASLYSRNAFFFGSNPTCIAETTAWPPISKACRAGFSDSVNSPTSGPRTPPPT